MKKAIFKNKLFYNLLIAFIIILMIYNGYVLITGNVYGIVAIGIEVVLLILIFTKNQYAKIAILIWTIVALVTAQGVGLIADLMDIFNDGLKAVKIDSLIATIIELAVGILIVDYTRRTVSVVSPNDDLSY